MNLVDKITHLPQDSGIYEYFDKDSRILYIGKAKNLKKRVKSYFRISGDKIAPAENLSPRIASMVAKITDINTIIVNNEQDALLLENSLIKQLKPRYNVLLRDDKTYPYILIDKSQSFPRLEIVRRIEKNRQYVYFGPYSSGIKDILESIYEFVPLVQKKSCLREKKACLFAQIGRCLAPCENRISAESYSEILARATHLLQNPSDLIALLSRKMQIFAQNLRFEDANIIKLRIQKIKQITQLSSIDLAKLYNIDIFAIAFRGDKGVLVKLFMRNGRISLSDYYFFHCNESEKDANYLYTQALINHYKRNTPLGLDAILLPMTLDSGDEISQFFSARFSRKIPLQAPKNGEKKRLVDFALKNAAYLLENSTESGILEDIKSLCSLVCVPNRIEIFDTSHHGGEHCVGAMVVFHQSDFAKDSYRKYLLNASDEYAQMREMLTRRAKDFAEIPPPDLWLIDGGMGQINLASEIIASSGANVEILAIAKEKIDFKAHRAKGGVRDIIRSKSHEWRLDRDDKRLQFLQKLRDEAHRFAISFHRKKKVAKIRDSPYTPAQTQKLLRFYGSFDAIKNAPQAEIAQILGRKNVGKK